MGHLLDMKDIARSIEIPTVHESICEVEEANSDDFWKEVYP